MAQRTDIAAIQACVGNSLDSNFIGERRIAGVIGEAPSRYSKSPALWNAAFRLLQMDAIYLPFDVGNNRLRNLASALRNSERLLGINVTVPHKLKIMEYLDDIDPGAALIRAVNTVVRAQNGKLIGYNTDGDGFIESLLKPRSEYSEAFVESLTGMDVLLLGAGGSARAVAFHLAPLLAGGELMICNRSFEHAQSLVADLRRYNARALPESELAGAAVKVGLIINSTTKGQGSMRLEGGNPATLEPYSALAPANLQTRSSEKPSSASQADIQANNQTSLAIAARVPKNVRFYDLIYFPEETVFLRHARQTGHATMNGKSMIINQAAIAFCERICRTELQTRRFDIPMIQRQIVDAMYGAW